MDLSVTPPARGCEPGSPAQGQQRWAGTAGWPLGKAAAAGGPEGIYRTVSRTDCLQAERSVPNLPAAQPCREPLRKAQPSVPDRNNPPGAARRNGTASAGAHGSPDCPPPPTWTEESKGCGGVTVPGRRCHLPAAEGSGPGPAAGWAGEGPGGVSPSCGGGEAARMVFGVPSAAWPGAVRRLPKAVLGTRRTRRPVPVAPAAGRSWDTLALGTRRQRVDAEPGGARKEVTRRWQPGSEALLPSAGAFPRGHGWALAQPLVPGAWRGAGWLLPSPEARSPRQRCGEKSWVCPRDGQLLHPLCHLCTPGLLNTCRAEGDLVKSPEVIQQPVSSPDSASTGWCSQGRWGAGGDCCEQPAQPAQVGTEQEHSDVSVLPMSPMGNRMNRVHQPCSVWCSSQSSVRSSAFTRSSGHGPHDVAWTWSKDKLLLNSSKADSLQPLLNIEWKHLLITLCWHFSNVFSSSLPFQEGLIIILSTRSAFSLANILHLPSLGSAWLPTHSSVASLKNTALKFL